MPTRDLFGLFWRARVGIPSAAARKGRGALKGDTHLRVPGENISKLLFTLVNMYGGNVTTFGAKEGAVTSGLPQILA